MVVYPRPSLVGSAGGGEGRPWDSDRGDGALWGWLERAVDGNGLVLSLDAKIIE